jgi:hypothetical protein
MKEGDNNEVGIESKEGTNVNCNSPIPGFHTGSASTIGNGVMHAIGKVGLSLA